MDKWEDSYTAETPTPITLVRWKAILVFSWETQPEETQTCSGDILVRAPSILPFPCSHSGYKSPDALPMSVLLQVGLPCHPIREQRKPCGTSGGIEEKGCDLRWCSEMGRGRWLRMWQVYKWLSATTASVFRFGPLDFYSTQCPHPQGTAWSWFPSHKAPCDVKSFRKWTALAQL